jgi:hypothetical protein
VVVYRHSGSKNAIWLKSIGIKAIKNSYKTIFGHFRQGPAKFWHASVVSPCVWQELAPALFFVLLAVYRYSGRENAIWLKTIGIKARKIVSTNLGHFWQVPFQPRHASVVSPCVPQEPDPAVYFQ